MSKEIPTENKMGILPINRLIVSMSLPMIASMLVQALYNIVDSIFVARLSEDALTAVTLAFPAQNIMIGVCVGTAVGMNSFLSKNLGEKNFDIANKTATNSIYISILCYVFFLIFGLFFPRTFIAFQTDILPIIDYGEEYLRIISVFSFGIVGQILFERLLQSTGRAFYSMLSQGTGAILNIILDPIMIFGLFGFPALGVAGAAIATVLGQVLACCVGIYFNITKNPDIKLTPFKSRPDFYIIRKIYSVGFPSIVMVSLGSIMVYGLNNILIAFSSTATAVFGSFFRLQSFVFMPLFGLNSGLVPIIAYNYGAKKPERIKKAYSLGLKYATLIMLVGFLGFILLPEQLLALFDASPGMLEIGVPSFRILGIQFIFVGICLVSSTFCQAMGRGFTSLILSLIRQVILVLPLAFIFSSVLGLDATWWAFPIAEVLTAGASLLFVRDIFAKQVNPLFRLPDTPVLPEEA